MLKISRTIWTVLNLIATLQAISIPPPPPPARPHLSQQDQQYHHGSSSEQADAMHGSSTSSAPSPSGHGTSRHQNRQPTAEPVLVSVPIRTRSQAAHRREEASSSPLPQPPEPGRGRNACRSSERGSGSSMVQHNGTHKPPQVWPPASDQSTGAAAAVQSWRHQKKHEGRPPADSEVMLRSFITLLCLS